MTKELANPKALYSAVSDEVDSVLIGNEQIIEGLTVALLTRGHVLLEGVPGVAKTTIANLFASATGLDVSRIQMTPDLLPADVTGTSVYREQTGEFSLQRGPIFTNLVVADEINRATPKTQSAFLEAMQEGSVTIEGETLSLPSVFMVIATQNPIEMEGTHGLPEAQRDRFQLKLTVDLPDEESEIALMNRFDGTPELGPNDISAVVSEEDITAARETVTEVYVDESIKSYIREIIAATRESPALEYGASPRATLLFMQTAKARAAIHGRDYVISDDVKALAESVLAHRVALSTDAELSDQSAREIIEEIVETVAAPGGDPEPQSPEATVSSDGGTRVSSGRE
ncbi:MoxR family ATPase [Halorussus gelatinilyticus]|uniref:MoxR family ATPase n=1 Tax=Halorussus gelatinilyticus TaxID=2937524 RepID=A0A8U0IE15_9EURY|nr:MoxR family ATPase [Halorussus gelatinilyticus]UPV98955.1 MoxR family ATPase [Halorussus gelatinilyticus]